MFSQKRKFYLEHFWSPYPVPVAGGICGRLIADRSLPAFQCEAGNKLVGSSLLFEFTNQAGEKILQKLNFENLIWYESRGQSEITPIEVLTAGDWVQIQTELTSRVLLLAPCLKPFMLGITNQRLYRDWLGFLNQVQQFFCEQRFDEIKTPTLVVCPGTEPFLEPFVTEFKFGKEVEKYFLPTSPELSLKKCLARGWVNIFEIRSCFRNGERSPLHLAEFSMLEWYRSFANLGQIKTDICNLLEKLNFPNWQNSTLVTLTMADLFKKYLQFDLQPDTTVGELVVLAKQLNLPVDSEWDFDDTFYLLYVDKIEPELKAYEFLIIEKYPPSQAALARLTDDGWGDRFEFYISGVEIANAFFELNDPVIQRQRFQEDLVKKRRYGKTEIPLDESFLLHLEQGMPPSAGIALGLERLFMKLYGVKDINQITAY
jgi:lysyl-tRNA synthetase class 2